MDVAKVVAYLLENSGQKVNDIVGINKCSHKRKKLVQVPTTAGTGSEATNISILKTGVSDTGVTQKSGIVDNTLMADIAVLDAELLTSLPKMIMAHTGVDAIVHAIESYTNPNSNMISDMLAIKSLELFGQSLLKAVDGQS